MSNNGPAVPEEIGHKHTNIQTRKHRVAIHKGIWNVGGIV